MKKIEDYLENLEKPEWGYISEVNVEGSKISIGYCKVATIFIDTEFEWECGITIESDCALGKQDLEFVLEVLDNREKIISLLAPAA
jgi:hypothetical protein